MATDYDIDLTFHDIATIAFKVVRTWAFNDVPSKPSSGTYFQVLFYRCFFFIFVYLGRKILQNGKATINEGSDGLQRLDKVVDTAKKYGVKVLLTLTNNWNPERPLQSTSWNRRANSDFPRGYLANDYGP